MGGIEELQICTSAYVFFILQHPGGNVLSSAGVWEISGIFGMNQLRSLVRSHAVKISLRGDT